MGECRPKDAPSWFDPFAAYRLPTGDSGKVPTPIRPAHGRALWREYAGLFLKSPTAGGRERQNTKRPSVLDQLDVLDPAGDYGMYPMRCVGIRTDMKAKIFEWVDAGFDVPAALLRDDAAWLLVDESIDFAGKCGAAIQAEFRNAFKGDAKQEHYGNLRKRMSDAFWTALAEPFRRFVLALSEASPAAGEEQRVAWADTVTREGQRSFEQAAAAVGDDAASLRKRVQGERRCRSRLYYLKEKSLKGGSDT